MADYVALRPEFDRDAELWTYEDVVEFLLDQFNYKRGNGGMYRYCRRAICQVMRDLSAKHRWGMFEGRVNLISEAPYSTGTIEYLHTGATNERQVTLTGGTFPTNALYYRVKIAGVDYEVDRRISSTVLTLRAESNPGANVVAGTSFNMYRAAYLLPSDFRKIVKVQDLETKTELEGVEFSDVARMQVLQASLGTPNMISIRNAKDVYGRVQLEFGPAPSSSQH